jgi:hypothetical protein
MQASGCFPDARMRSCSRGEELIPLRLCAFVNGFAGHAMKRRLGRALLAVALTSLVAYPLQAATLDAIRGHMMVNRGAGYEFARSSVEVAPGDMIIPNAGGNAQLVYADGCNVLVEAGSLITVRQSSPCAGKDNAGAFGLTPSTLVIGAVAIGGGVGAAVLFGKGGDKPASP